MGVVVLYRGLIRFVFLSGLDVLMFYFMLIGVFGDFFCFFGLHHRFVMRIRGG